MKTITLCDTINNRSYDILLAPDDARRAYTDIGYASALLRAAVEEEQREEAAMMEEEHEEAADKQQSVEEQEERDDEQENVSVLYRWTPVVVMLLLRTYQDLQKKFEAGKVSHKKCWECVADKLNAAGYTVTGPQCSSKLRSLKKTYKSIKDHNSKSGNDRRTWQYFEVMQEIFSKAAWCEPVAVASSSGVIIKRPDADSAIESASTSSCGSTKLTALNLLKRRLDQKAEQETSKKARHEERMAMDRQLLAALKELSQK